MKISDCTKFILGCLVFAFACAAHGNGAASPAPAPGPVKIIFDTDMGNDVDDALALAMIHSLQRRGACELLAVTLTKSHAEAGPYVAAVNAYYGFPNVPIGVTPDAPTPYQGKYLGVALRRSTDGRLLHPSNYDASKAPMSVDLLRRVLAESEDGGVVIVQVGFSTNLARLLDTPADAVSPLTGMELVKRKVRLVSAMAGKFAQDGVRKIEFNVARDIPAAIKFSREWPTPIVWSGFEVGVAVTYPAWSVDNDFAYEPHHIIKDSYQAYNPTPHERPCWDLTSVAYAVWPGRGYFSLSPAGRVTIADDGETSFAAVEGGRDRYLLVDKEQAARLRELFAALATEPPKKR